MKDPYTYEDTGVLKNKMGIKDKRKLDQAEADIGFIKLINIDSVNFDYFDDNLIKNIHKHIFEDVFDWAGEYRKVSLYKEELVLPGYSIPYAEPKNIEKELSDKMKDLNSIAWQNMDVSEISIIFARKIATIWRVHPFRDGNTRAMLSFSYLYAKEHGFPFDLKTFIKELSRKYDENGNVASYSIRDKFVLASLDSKDYPEVEHLAYVFECAINSYGEKAKQL